MVAPSPAPTSWRHRSRRHRLVSLALVLLIEALILYALLTWVIQLKPRAAEAETKTFDVAPGPAPKKATTTKAASAAATKPVTTPPPPKTPVPPPIIPPKPNDSFLHLNNDDFAASDIGKLPRSGSGGSGPAPVGPGEGPGGAPLYNAEWVREPTDGELAFYLPPVRAPGAWAMIACRTIPNNRVDNCYTLGESPPGSRLAAGLRQAAWQFLVRPPRVGNKPQVGAWVRIRLTFDRGAGG